MRDGVNVHSTLGFLMATGVAKDVNDLAELQELRLRWLSRVVGLVTDGSALVGLPTVMLISFCSVCFCC